MDTIAHLEQLAASPKPFAARLTFSDGTIDIVGQPRRRMAENLVARYSAKIGRPFRCFNADSGEVTFPTLQSVELVELH